MGADATAGPGESSGLDTSRLGAMQKVIVRLLSSGPMTVEALAQRLGKDVPHTRAKLRRLVQLGFLSGGLGRPATAVYGLAYLGLPEAAPQRGRASHAVSPASGRDGQLDPQHLSLLRLLAARHPAPVGIADIATALHWEPGAAALVVGQLDAKGMVRLDRPDGTLACSLAMPPGGSGRMAPHGAPRVSAVSAPRPLPSRRAPLTEAQLLDWLGAPMVADALADRIGAPRTVVASMLKAMLARGEVVRGRVGMVSAYACTQADLDAAAARYRAERRAEMEAGKGAKREATPLKRQARHRQRLDRIHEEHLRSARLVVVSSRGRAEALRAEAKRLAAEREARHRQEEAERLARASRTPEAKLLGLLAFPASARELADEMGMTPKGVGTLLRKLLAKGSVVEVAAGGVVTYARADEPPGRLAAFASSPYVAAPPTARPLKRAARTRRGGKPAANLEGRVIEALREPSTLEDLCTRIDEKAGVAVSALLALSARGLVGARIAAHEEPEFVTGTEGLPDGHAPRDVPDAVQAALRGVVRGFLAGGAATGLKIWRGTGVSPLLPEGRLLMGGLVASGTVVVSRVAKGGHVYSLRGARPRGARSMSLRDALAFFGGFRGPPERPLSQKALSEWLGVTREYARQILVKEESEGRLVATRSLSGAGMAYVAPHLGVSGDFVPVPHGAPGRKVADIRDAALLAALAKPLADDELLGATSLPRPVLAEHLNRLVGEGRIVRGMLEGHLVSVAAGTPEAASVSARDEPMPRQARPGREAVLAAIGEAREPMGLAALLDALRLPARSRGALIRTLGELRDEGRVRAKFTRAGTVYLDAAAPPPVPRRRRRQRKVGRRG